MSVNGTRTRHEPLLAVADAGRRGVVVASDGSCCTPARGSATCGPADSLAEAAASEELVAAIGAVLRPIPGGFLEMGTPKSRYDADLDSPRRRLRLAAFRMADRVVTNELWARFVAESGHRSTAEREGWSFVFAPFLSEPHHYPEAPPGTHWWRKVSGACWAHPEGPGSDLTERMDHPVVHVSWEDAAALARFTGFRLPSEAQWEHAARGGLKRMKFPWGNALEPDGTHRHNIWQGRFPEENTAADGWRGTAPAASFPPNGYGLFNMTGNVWEWVADWFGPLSPAFTPPICDPTGPETGTGRVMRGGSHLCHDSYCARYFVHSRSLNTPDSSTGHIGFRLAAAP